MASTSAQLPVRDHMDDPATVWRHTKPDFSSVDQVYLAGKRMSHKAGSLEQIVENLVKTWEMESSHKVRAEDWQSVDREAFTLSVNGGRKFNLEENIALGNYQMLMAVSPLYDASKEDNDSSQKLFRNCFKSGFAWELLEIQSGPPVVSFTWRHWGKWEGPYNDTPPTGEILEMYGSCMVRVDDKLKIQAIEVYYDPNPMIATLMDFKRPGGCPYSENASFEAALKSCPVARQNKN